MGIMAQDAAKLFEETLGWPYLLGGYGEQGIDCSGEWRRVYIKSGAKVPGGFHGSNSQYHRFSGDRGEITGAGMLRVGMAVYKVRQWADEDKGHWAYGQAPGNIYHVGCVTGVNPLRIVHATPPQVMADKGLGKWSLWSWLNEVEQEDETLEEADILFQANVTTQTGPLNLRAGPGTTYDKIAEVPKGTVLPITDDTGDWWRVLYGGRQLFASAQYLTPVEEPAGSLSPDGEYVRVRKSDLDAAYMLIGKCLGKG